MQQNNRVKVKQFEWFEIETKVRQIIQEVLGPMQKSILENASGISKLKSNQMVDERRLQQIGMMVSDDPKVFETGIFSRVEKSFQEHARTIAELKRQVEEENQYIENKFKILDVRMMESSEMLKNVAAFKERMIAQTEVQNDNIASMKTGIESLIDEQARDIMDTRRLIAENAQAAEKSSLASEQQLRRVKQEIAKVEDSLIVSRQMFVEKTACLDEHELLVRRHCSQILDLQESKAQTRRLGAQVQDMDNEVRKALFKVQAVCPLVTQAQISECLSAILPTKMSSRISIYEQKRYAHLNAEVLEKDFENIKECFDGIALVRARQKRCVKEVVQLKRKKLLQMGIDIDHVTYEQREKYYAELSLEGDLHADEEEAKVAHQVDQAQIRAIMDTCMTDYTASLTHRLALDAQDRTRYLQGIEEEIRFQVSKLEEQIKNVKSTCEAFYTEHLLEAKDRTVSLAELSSELRGLSSQVKEMNGIQRLFYNFCSLMNHLCIQDEIDKQNISLMGARESGVQGHSPAARESVVSLGEGCFSCNGHPATTLSAFKIACLAYHPSAIRIDSQEYKREELLEFTTNMLQSIKKFITTNNIASDSPKNTTPRPRPALSQNSIKSDDDSPYLKRHSMHTNPVKDVPVQGPTATRETPVHSDLREAYNSLPHSRVFVNNREKQEKKVMNLLLNSRNKQSKQYLQTEASALTEDMKWGSNQKFRKTYKRSMNTTVSSNITKQKSSLCKVSALNEDMMNSSAIFNSLKKKHHL